MRVILGLAAWSILATTALADPPNVSGPPPTIVLAQADSSGGKAMLMLTVPVTVPTQEVRTVVETVKKEVNGRIIEEQIQREVTVTVNKIVWKVQQVDLQRPGVSVTDASGRAIARLDVMRRLDRETAVLYSEFGRIDPFYLQTTRPDTLVVTLSARPAPNPRLPGPRRP